MPNDKILKEVSDYYTDKVLTHGATPQGVDWNGAESQELRFAQLTKVIHPNDTDFSILDYGCGFGSMYGWMLPRFQHFRFAGLDISQAMLEQAKQLYPQCEWMASVPDSARYDYVVASGIFNVKMENTTEAWEKYILDTLAEMDRLSTKGFAFNVLTSYSDKEYMKEYLHYANPNALFDHCKKQFSRFVALHHDYPLYEFTMVVRK